jgi:hypothetical protein
VSGGSSSSLLQTHLADIQAEEMVGSERMIDAEREESGWWLSQEFDSTTEVNDNVTHRRVAHQITHLIFASPIHHHHLMASKA